AVTVLHEEAGAGVLRGDGGGHGTGLQLPAIGRDCGSGHCSGDHRCQQGHAEGVLFHGHAWFSGWNFRVWEGAGHQPKPTPAPTEVSSLLKAPPKVTVARSEIARW